MKKATELQKIVQYLYDLDDEQLAFQLKWMLQNHYRTFSHLVPEAMDRAEWNEIDVRYPLRLVHGRNDSFYCQSNPYLAAFTGWVEYPVKISDKLFFGERWHQVCIAIPEDSDEKPVYGICRIREPDDPVMDVEERHRQLFAQDVIADLIDVEKPHIELPPYKVFYELTENLRIDFKKLEEKGEPHGTLFRTSPARSTMSAKKETGLPK